MEEEGWMRGSRSCKGGSIPLIVGHKANTIRVIRRYLAQGADIVEIDVFYDESLGDFVVKHVDEQTSSLTGGRWERGLARRLADMVEPIVELVRHERKVSDVMRSVGGLQGVMLDVKVKGRARELASLISSMGLDGPIYVSSRYHRDLMTIKRLLPHVKTLLTFSEEPVEAVIKYLEAAEADGISIRLAFLEPSLVKALKGRGYTIAVWTVNDPWLAVKAAMMSVDMIITDTPHTIKKALEFACGKPRGTA